MPSIDVLYKDGADAHFSDGQVITVKPGGALWSLAELSAGTRAATLDVDTTLHAGVLTDISAYQVDRIVNPTTLVRV